MYAPSLFVLKGENAIGYKTLKNAGSGECVIKRSRFIGYAAPVSSEGEAVDFIESIRKKHRDASHNCYAYSLRCGQLKRYSDDGEPQGTAGIVILELLKKEEIYDCVVVVTRYFGGTLLGTGGLSRAYSQAAKFAVQSAGIGERILWHEMSLVCDYSLYGRCAPLIAAFGGRVSDSVFETEVRLCFTLPAEAADAFLMALTEESGGKISPVFLKEFNDFR